MDRRDWLKLAATGFFSSAIVLPRRTAAAEVVKIATLAPRSSPWGQVFKTWEDAVTQRSGGAVELQFFYNGIQGDESSVAAKMKFGQLDGAALSGVGLAKIYRPILALQMPGLFTTWAKFDAARDTLRPDLEKGVKEAGFSILGWVDIGSVHTMSKGFAIKIPDDLRDKAPFSWRDDPIQAVLYQTIGAKGVVLNTPEVLPHLNFGDVNVVNSTSGDAEALAWASKLDTIIADVSGMITGGLVITGKRLDALSPEHRTLIVETGQIAANALAKRIPAEDDAAFARIKSKMTVVTRTPAEQAKWNAIYKQVRTILSQGTFAPELVAKLEALAK
jgi:TRAP-type C4-dicarboxylate transport system substrate-binding protein